MAPDDLQARPAPDEWAKAWQRASRPMMVRTLVALAAFFFVASLVQLAYLNWQISHPPALAADALLDPTICRTPAGVPPLSPQVCLTLQRDRAAVLLEENLVARRYHQGDAQLMFGIWSRYLGFVTGMILAVVGAAFILGKLAEPPTQLDGALGDMRAAITSSSPGLILALLGVVLIVASITKLHKLDTRDGAIYLPGAPRLPDDTPRVPDDGSPIKLLAPPSDAEKDPP